MAFTCLMIPMWVIVFYVAVGHQASATLLHKGEEFQLVHSKATFTAAKSLY
jgi:hypothetical protein